VTPFSWPWLVALVIALLALQAAWRSHRELRGWLGRDPAARVRFARAAALALASALIAFALGSALRTPERLSGEEISGDNSILWDPATETVTAALAFSGFDIWCSGHSFLADGRLLVTGGAMYVEVGLPNAALYDPFADAWTPLPDMNAGRWYPTNTTLGNGDVLVTSGGGKRVVELMERWPR
jgi:hypothetical protein